MTQRASVPDPLHTPPWPTPNGKRALITGITGQDGSYLADLLLVHNLEVLV